MNRSSINRNSMNWIRWIGTTFSRNWNFSEIGIWTWFVWRWVRHLSIFILSLSFSLTFSHTLTDMQTRSNTISHFVYLLLRLPLLLSLTHSHRTLPHLFSNPSQTLINTLLNHEPHPPLLFPSYFYFCMDKLQLKSNSSMRTNFSLKNNFVAFYLYSACNIEVNWKGWHVIDDICLA